MRIALLGLLVIFMAYRPSNLQYRNTAPLAIEPMYWVGWRNSPAAVRDNLSFRQRALQLHRFTRGSVLIARNGTQALQLLRNEIRHSANPRPLVFLGHGDAYGLFMDERNGLYRDTVRTRPDLAVRYGGGGYQQFLSRLSTEQALQVGISEALFLSCYGAQIAREWTLRTGQPTVGALDLVHPVLTPNRRCETGVFRSDRPFVRFWIDESSTLRNDTLGLFFSPIAYWRSQTDHLKNPRSTASRTNVQEPNTRRQVFDR